MLPGIVFTLSSFYRRNQMTTRMGWLNGLVVLSGAFGGLLAYGFSLIPAHGTLHTWRYIFLIEGIMTILVGCAAMMLPNSLETASFLTEEEREFAVSRGIEESKALTSEPMNKKTFIRALRHWPTQLNAFGLIGALCCQSSMALFSVSTLPFHRHL